MSTVAYSTSNNDKILIRSFKGYVNVEDILASWNYIIEYGLINSKIIGVISDFCESELIIDDKDFSRFKEYYDAKSNLFKNLKTTQIIITPQIVFPILFQLKYEKIKSKSFSTIEAASWWILT